MDLTNVLRQQITWWPVTRNAYNELVFAPPEPLGGRWEARTEEFINAEGQRTVSRAVALLSKDVSPGDYLAEGDYSESDPRNVEGAYRVEAFQKVPDLRVTSFIRKAYM